MSVSAVVDCPRPSCGRQLTLELEVGVAPGSARPGPAGATAVDVEVRRIVNLPQVMADHYREFHPAEYAAAVKTTLDETSGASKGLPAVAENVGRAIGNLGQRAAADLGIQLANRTIRFAGERPTLPPAEGSNDESDEPSTGGSDLP